MYKYVATYYVVTRVAVAVKVRFQPKRVLAIQNAFGLESQSKRVLTGQNAFGFYYVYKM